MVIEHGTPIAPSTFYDARGRTTARAERDEQRQADIGRVHSANLLEGVEHQLAAHAGGRPPAQDPPRVRVEDEGDVDGARPRRPSPDSPGRFRTGSRAAGVRRQRNAHS
jgi:hypothetical protein